MCSGSACCFVSEPYGFGIATGNCRLDDLRSALVPESEAPTFVFAHGHGTEKFSSVSGVLGTEGRKAFDDLVGRLGVTRQVKCVTQPLKANVEWNPAGAEPLTQT